MTAKFYCTNTHCNGRNQCKNAQGETRDKLRIQGQGNHATPCPDFLLLKQVKNE
jgi:hypothetical protein